MIDPVLKKNGWKSVYDEDPPKGESVLIGESINGILHTIITEITKPFKKDGNNYFYYKKNGEYHVLRSDLYWKEYE